MITRFRVQNYKALRDVTLDLTPMHLLIGPNDSGKTSILEAMAALCRSVDHRLTDAFEGSWVGEGLVYNRASNRVVRLEVTIPDPDSEDPIDYRLDVCFDAKASVAGRFSETLRYHESSCFLNQESAATQTQLHEKCILEMPFRPKDSQGGDVEALGTVVIDALQGVQFYRWVPEHLALPAALDSRRRMRMEMSGFGLPTILDDIRDVDPKRYDQLEERFKEIFRDVDSIRPRTETAYQSVSYRDGRPLNFQQAEGKGLHFRFKGDSVDVPASQVSDGMLLVLAYLAILFLPKPPRVLLVEEPENGIHPARLEQVLTILRDLVNEQSHTQVVLTSHSPYVVSLFEPEEVTICHKGDDGAVQVRRLSDSKTVQEQVDFFTLGEIWTLEGDEALLETAREAPSAS